MVPAGCGEVHTVRQGLELGQDRNEGYFFLRELKKNALDPNPLSPAAHPSLSSLLTCAAGIHFSLTNSYSCGPRVARLPVSLKGRDSVSD